ncbi:MAG: hypothetical protein ACTHXC_06730 [Brachybacterium sp.]
MHRELPDGTDLVEAFLASAPARSPSQRARTLKAAAARPEI